MSCNYFARYYKDMLPLCFSHKFPQEISDLVQNHKNYGHILGSHSNKRHLDKFIQIHDM